MKKALSLLLALLVTVALVACGNGGSAVSQQPAPQEKSPPAQGGSPQAAPSEKTLAQQLTVDPNQEVTITVMSMHHTEQRRSLMDQNIALLNEKYPNIKVEHNPVEDYINAIKMGFDSGDAPDIVYIDDTTQNMLERYDYLMDITDIAKEMKWADVSKPGSLEYQNVRHPDVIYSAPYISGPRVVWYNKEIFNKLNLNVPTTLDEFDDVLAKVKEAGYTPFEASIRSTLWHIDGCLFGMVPFEDISKWYYLEDSTDIYKTGRKEALEKVAEWVERGYFREGITSIDHNNLNVLFPRGETVFYVSGASAAGPLASANMDVGAFPFPKKSKDFPTTLVDASDSGWAIRADLPEEKLAAAVAFIDSFFTEQSARLWTEGGFVSLLTFDQSDAKVTPQQLAAIQACEGAQMGYFLDNAAPGLLDAMEILNARLHLKEITGADYDALIDQQYEELKAEELSKRS